MLPSYAKLKKYIVRRLIPALIIIIGGIAFINFFLAYRLENYLKVELGRRTAEATDGFYQLTFDDLSIHLISGELKLEGIALTPDSTVFMEWNTRDSLPLNYVNAYIESIDFRGINLIWTWNYRQLHFETFEVLSPDIRIYDAYNSFKHYRKPKNTTSKNLHELIEPYIDVLTVRHLNLENVSTSFTVESPSTPIIYQLIDANFHGYNFRLDSTSYTDGKLLYCDNFEFFTNKPQVLIKNEQFLLETDTILVSTSDSLIYLEDIQLTPQNFSLVDYKTNPVNSLEGKIKEVNISGIGFKRQDSNNFLHANSLDVITSDIHIYDLSLPASADSNIEKNTTLANDTVPPIYSLSLYDLISPIFHQVSINHIGIREAKMNYLLAVKDTLEQYRMEDFEFHAWDFLIDSIAEKEHGLWYAKNFSLEASGLWALMNARNHRMQINRISLNTEQGSLSIENVRINPLASKSRNDFVAAKVDTISVAGLWYDNGISADSLIIESPVFRYYTTSEKKIQNGSSNSKNNSGVDVEDLFNPLLRYLQIQNIRLNQADIAFREKDRRNTDIFRIQNFNFFANNFFVNESTWKNQNDMWFTCDDYGFSFSDFSNYFSNNNYHLAIQNAFFSTIKSELFFKDVKLTPKDNIWEETPGSYVSFFTPTIRLKGFNDLLNNREEIKVDSISVETPTIQIMKSNSAEAKKIEQKVEEYTPFSPFNSIEIGSVRLNDTHLSLINKTSGENLSVEYDLLNMKTVHWNTRQDRKFNIHQFQVKHPQVKWEVTQYDSIKHTTEPKTLPEMLYPYAENISISSFFSNDVVLEATQPYMKANFLVDSFILDSLDWNFNSSDRYLRAGTIAINHPEVMINQTPVPQSMVTNTEVNDTIQKSLYDQLALLGKEIQVSSLTVSNANIDYQNQQTDTSSIKQKLNTTDFSIQQLAIDNQSRKFEFNDISFKTENLVFPINNGFYDMVIKRLELRNDWLKLDSFHMVSPYPKTDFAYLHPSHKDWFDVKFATMEMKGIDLPPILSGEMVHIRNTRIDDPMMLNYKNKKIPVPSKWMPMIYEGLQKAPIKIVLDTIQVNNFGVVYEEISKKGTEPGRLVFTELNGTITGVTNIVSYHDQYFKLVADGKFYGKGHFNAVWLLPVDSLNDRFILTAHLPDFDLTALNEMITPLASAELKSGYLNDIYFTMDAGSIGGSIYMLLLYEDMKVNIFKIKDGEKKDNKLLNLLVNAVVRDNNPRRKNGKPKEAFDTIERDPYHSSFNYLWQLLRPPLAESVGVTKTHQNIAKGIVNAINKVKNLFGKGKKKEQEPVEEIQN